MAPARKELDQSAYSNRLATRIVELREKAKLSVEEVAEIMTQNGFDMKPVTLRTWENGGRTPKWDAIPFLAMALKTTPRKLIPEK